MIYSIRLRDVQTGREQWVLRPDGERWWTEDRWTADMYAYAHQGLPWVLPYVVELDIRVEVPTRAGG